MSKYALVMTADSRLLPGVHAMLNASKYYGFDDVEFHLLYWPGPEMTEFLSDMAASGHYPKLVPINLVEYRDCEGEEEQGHKPVYYLKFYRSLYAGRLKDYDAVGFMDADMCIVGNIRPYFDLAATSGRILMVDWKYNQDRVDSGWYMKYKIHATSGCPYDPCATFFTPGIWGKHFEKIHKLGMNVVKRSEMPTMNYMIIMDGLLEEIIRLPSVRWTCRKWGAITTQWMECAIDNRPDDKERKVTEVSKKMKVLITYPERASSFLCCIRGQTEIDMGWDLEHGSLAHPDFRRAYILSIHGRWHFRATLQKKTCHGELLKRHRAMEQNQNIANIWKAFKFFNFCCYTRIDDWKPEWGAPNEYIDVESGLLLKDESRELVI